MRYFFTYLKDKSKKLIPFLIFFSIFFISFLLYNIDLRAVIYPFFVCIFLYIVYIALFDFRRSKKRHDTLMFISENINALPDALIKPQNCCEDDLVNVINSLLEEIKTIKTEYDESLNDTIEYFISGPNRVLVKQKICFFKKNNIVQVQEKTLHPFFKKN